MSIKRLSVRERWHFSTMSWLSFVMAAFAGLFLFFSLQPRTPYHGRTPPYLNPEVAKVFLWISLGMFIFNQLFSVGSKPPLLNHYAKKEQAYELVAAKFQIPLKHYCTYSSREAGESYGFNLFQEHLEAILTEVKNWLAVLQPELTYGLGLEASNSTVRDIELTIRDQATPSTPLIPK